jgi:hypothetical protein
MWETLATIGSIILIIFVPAVLILWLRDKIRNRLNRESPAEHDLRLEAWRQRMLHPEIEAVQDYCGGKIPERLIAMFSDHDLVFKHNLELCPPGKDPKKDSSWWIGDFVPLTVEDQQWTCDLSRFDRKGCCFAGDGMGNFYWLPVDPERTADAAVYFACHDPWGNEKVAESLDEFLSWPRVATTKR